MPLSHTKYQIVRLADSLNRKDLRFPQKLKRVKRSWRRSDRTLIRIDVVVRTSILPFLPLSFVYTV